MTNTEGAALIADMHRHMCASCRPDGETKCGPCSLYARAIELLTRAPSSQPQEESRRLREIIRARSRNDAELFWYVDDAAHWLSTQPPAAQSAERCLGTKALGRNTGETLPCPVTGRDVGVIELRDCPGCADCAPPPSKSVAGREGK